MRKWNILSAFLILLFLTACAASPERHVRNALGVDLPAAEQVTSSDSHGGFHGDGMLLTELSYRPGDGENVEKRLADAGWKPLPATENLQRVMTDELLLPEITNGLWYFYDRHSESSDPFSDAELFDRYSLNFTFAVFDADMDTLYYLEFDT